MFPRESEGARSFFARVHREQGIVRFFYTVPGSADAHTYGLCAQAKRHYTATVTEPRTPHKISKDFLPCDGSCANGTLVENPTKIMQLLVGMLILVPRGNVIVVTKKDRYDYLSHQEFPAGSIVSPETIRGGKLLKDGETLEAKRTLQQVERINLTPVEFRPSAIVRRLQRDKEVLITEITDSITNHDGKALITNNEEELREQAARLEEQWQAVLQKQETDDKERRADFARGVSNYLRQEQKFTREQVEALFKFGPGALREAVDVANWSQREGLYPGNYPFFDRMALAHNYKVINAAELILTWRNPR